MKIVAGAVIIIALLLANVVAAGVFLVLGPLVPRGDDAVATVGMLAVGIVAVGCALLFLLGALRNVPRWLQRFGVR